MCIKGLATHSQLNVPLGVLGLSDIMQHLLLQVKSKSERMAQAEQVNNELSRQLTAERKAAKQAGAGAQKQLLGSMRRLQYMVITTKIDKTTLLD